MLRLGCHSLRRADTRDAEGRRQCRPTDVDDNDGSRARPFARTRSNPEGVGSECDGGPLSPVVTRQGVPAPGGRDAAAVIPSLSPWWLARGETKDEMFETRCGNQLALVERCVTLA
jgi:hypothetical protein